MIYKKRHYRLSIVFMLWLFLIIINPAWAQKESERPLVSYMVQVPDTVNRGNQFQLCIVFDIAESWYIYAPTGNNAAQGMVEAKIGFKLPKGITTVSEFKWPKPHFKGSYEVYEGKGIKISSALNTSTDLKAGHYEIKVKIRYQTCTENMCLQPIKEEFNIKIYIK